MHLVKIMLGDAFHSNIQSNSCKRLEALLGIAAIPRPNIENLHKIRILNMPENFKKK